MSFSPKYPARGMVRAAALVVPAMFTLSACGLMSKGDKGKDQSPPEVGFKVMHPTSVPVVIELPGRIDAARTAEVRPQISGVIRKRLFTEGSMVRAGQPLYLIDASLYRAALDQAQANLASAEANAAAQQAKAARYRPLAAQGAVAVQDYTDAAAAARQGAAAVAQSRAALNTARINLRFTTVPAPIGGRIGRSLLTEGALVTNAQADPMAVISVLDPVNVDLQQSAADMTRLRQPLAAAGAANTASTVWLFLDDGSKYALPGRLTFSEVTVDPATGSVTLRARFPNPEGLLMPGMFVRARIEQGSQSGVFLVPQTALTRDPHGNAQVLVVTKDNKAEQRTVTALRTQGSDWVVAQGLADGDRVITQGLGKAKAGKPVKAVPDTTPQVPRAADGARRGG